MKNALPDMVKEMLLQVRSLIVNAYLRDGYGARIYSSYYKRLLILAAVMYVDDTDLVHWSSVPSCTPTELIAAAQTATYAWGRLAIAPGAAMKPEKCYAYPCSPRSKSLSLNIE